MPGISPITSPKYVVIVAGGSGTRMQSDVPKQFLLLNRRPILMHTVEAFYHSVANPTIIIVLHQDFQSYWQQLCNDHDFNIPHQLITGGETRFHSVKNGLAVIPDDPSSLIAVHDAVRPLTSKKIIEESYQHAATFGNAIVAVKSRDSVRQFKDGFSKHLTREEIYLVQTPQTFQAKQIKDAYQQPYHTKFTDDASVIEETGIRINLIEGSYQNIKITFPEDLAIAELLVGSNLL